MDAVVHRTGEGETHKIGSGSSVTIKAAGDQTDGTFFLSETVIEPGFPGPPAHVHHQLHDMFFVLDGTLTVRLQDRTMEAAPGTFVCVPPGVVHTFSNQSDAPVRFLNFNTPSGWEGYMRELSKQLAGGRRPTSEEIGRIASGYDFHTAT